MAFSTILQWIYVSILIIVVIEAVTFEGFSILDTNIMVPPNVVSKKASLKYVLCVMIQDSYYLKNTFFNYFFKVLIRFKMLFITFPKIAIVHSYITKYSVKNMYFHTV